MKLQPGAPSPPARAEPFLSVERSVGPQVTILEVSVVNPG